MTLNPTNNWHADYTATVGTSVLHADQTLGTIRLFRRESIVSPDGTVCKVPVVSGNAVRGVLRDISADLLHADMGGPKLPLPAVHLLWAGGALAKTDRPLSDADARELTGTIPHVGLFGGAGGGRLFAGRLQVGKLIPIVQETAHLVGAVLPDAVTGTLPTVRDVLQVEANSRMDNVDHAQRVGAIDPDEITDDETTQMRYESETLAAGTVLWGSFGLRGATDVEVAWFHRVLTAWVESGSHVGGRGAAGHGRILIPATGPNTTVIPAQDGRHVDLLKAVS